MVILKIIWSGLLIALGFFCIGVGFGGIATMCIENWYNPSAISDHLPRTILVFLSGIIFWVIAARAWRKKGIKSDE